MNLATDQIISIISAVGISTIISTIFTFVQANKKNNLDLITKERSEWRKNLKEILSELNDGNEKDSTLIKLKSQINPYGKDIEIKNTKPYFMKDGHIWDELEKSDQERDYDRLSFFVELLLKYDWERSKQEIKFKPSKFLDWSIYLLILFSILYSCYIAFDKYQSEPENILLLFLGVSSFVSLILFLLQKQVTNIIKKNPSKNPNEQVWIFTIFYGLPYFIVVFTLITCVEFLKFNISTVVFASIGLFVYEYYFLSSTQLVEVEDDYIREIERTFISQTQRRIKETKLLNLNNRLENKLYTYGATHSMVNPLRKKRKKLIKKLIQKSRPDLPIFHPILYYNYREKRYRISKIIKIMLTKENQK